MPLVEQILRLLHQTRLPSMLVLMLMLGFVPAYAQPDALNDQFEANTATEIELDVLANDDYEDGTVLGFPVQPTHGQVEISDNQTLIYKSDPLFAGEDVFSYTICDAEGACDAALIEVEVSYSAFCSSLPTQTLNDTIYRMYCSENSVVEVPSVGYELIQGHVRNYIVHDQPFIAQSSSITSSASFVVQLSQIENLETNATYYVSVVTGPEAGFGVVDLESPCSRASSPIPLVVLECLDPAYTIEYEEDWDYYIIDLAPVGGLPPFDGSSYQIDGTWTGTLAAGESVEITLDLDECFNFFASDSEGNSGSTFTVCPQISDAQSHCLPVYHEIMDCDSTNYEVFLRLDEDLFSEGEWSDEETFTIKNNETQELIGEFAFSDLPIFLGEFEVDFANDYNNRTEYFVIGSGCFYLFDFGSQDCFPLPPESSCLSIPGTVPEDILLVCGNEEVQVQTEGQYIGPGDFLTYILHTEPDSELGTLFDANAEGIFSIESHPLLQTNVIYYISPSIYPYDNAFLEECSSVAPGQPIMFLEMADFQVTDNFICSYSTEDCSNFTEYKELFINIANGVPPYSYMIEVNGESIEGISFDGDIDLGVIDGIGGDIRMYVSDSEHPCEFYYESLYNFCTPFWSSNTPYIGNMEQEPLYACNEEPIQAVANCISNVSSNLLVGYVLHDNYDNQLGNVIAVSESGAFTIDDIGDYSGELFLSGVVINDNDQGLDMLLQTELPVGVYSLAPGTPVLFLEDDCETLIALTDHVEAQSSIAIDIDVLANDYIPEEATASVTEITEMPFNGTAVLIGNLIQYTADDYFEGNDLIVYTVCTEDGMCDTAEVEISVTFNCPSDPGVMPANDLLVCDQESFSIESVGADIAEGFLLNYVLHTSPGLGLGSIVAQSTDGSFNFPAEGSISPDGQYYVSAVTGPDDGNGMVDLLTECTVSSAGTSVQFLSPIDILWSYNYLGFDESDCAIQSNYEIVLFVDGGYGAYAPESSYTISGAINSSTSINQVSNSILQGDNADLFSITVSDELGCSQSFDLEVMGNPALQYSSLSLASTDIEIAANEPAELSTSCALAIGFGNDQLGFVLYSEPGNPTGSMIELNSSGSFSADLFSCGAQFYGIAVIGSDDGSGLPNLDDSSFPLVWSEEASISIIGAATATVQLDQNSLNIPAGDGFTIGTECLLTDGLDNPVLAYVLHTEEGNPQGSLLTVNTSGAFTSDDLYCGINFYVSGVLASDDGTGLPNLTNSSFPLIWSAASSITISGADAVSVSLNEDNETVPAATDLTVTLDCQLAEGVSNEQLGFVLHSNADDPQGSLIAFNSSGTFDASLLQCNNQFFVSAVLGSDDGNGLPNLESSSFPLAWSNVVTFNIDGGGENLTVNPVIECLSDSAAECLYESGVNFGIEITNGTAPFEVSLSIDNGVNISETYDSGTIDFGYMIQTAEAGFSLNYTLSISDAANNCFEDTAGLIACSSGNIPPYIGSMTPGNLLICEDDLLSISVSCTADWMDNASDYILGYFLHTAAADDYDLGLILATSSNGVFDYTAAEGYYGQELYTSAVYAPGAGGTPSLDALSSLNTAVGPSVIFLQNCNLISANDDVTSVEIGAEISINVTENDSHELNDAFEITQINLAPSVGSVQISDGELLYVADDDTYLGEVSFEYMICDNANNCDTGTVTVTITSDNNAPIATDDIINQSYSDQIPDEIIIDATANDNDPDGDQLNLTIVTGPTTGSAEVTDGQIYFYPANNTSNETITYSICDNSLPVYCDTATVTINLTNTNEAPIAADDTVNILYDQSPPLDYLIDALENDSDSNGDVLSISITEQPAIGSAEVNAEGDIIFTLGGMMANSAPVVITYEICDDAIPALCDQGQITITASTSNEAPATVSDTLVIYYVDELPSDTTINVIQNDTDNDSNSIAVTDILNQPSVGSVITDGISLTYVSADGADGEWMSVLYNVCDDAIPSACTEGQLLIRLCQSDISTPVNQTEELLMGSTFEFDPEIQEEILEVFSETEVEFGALDIQADGSLTYTPEDIFYGDVIFDLHIISENGSNCPTVDSYEFTLSYEIDCSAEFSCVWPGDTDLNGVSNGHDVLPIGFAYNSMGPERFNASLLWEEQPAADWTEVFANTANYKHADTNGDGIVDDQDLDAIYQNYGLMAGKTGETESEETVVWLELLTPNPEVFDTVKWMIHLGTEEQPAIDAYGISFAIQYDSTVVDQNSIFTDFSPSWLTSGIDPLNFTISPPELEIIDMAHSRTDQAPQSGFGGIGIVGFVITSKVNIIGKQDVTLEDFQLEILNLLVIDNEQQPIPVTQLSMATPIEVAAPDSEIGIAIYPNPAVDKIQVQLEGFSNRDIEKVWISDLAGRAFDLSHMITESQEQFIDLEDLESGVYILRFETGKGTVIEKLVIH